jgi:hypothetical protein
MCFIDNETSDNYDFSIKNLVCYLCPGVWPLIFACNTDDQLIQSVLRYFPLACTKIIICGWHVLKNILTNCKAKFETIERWDEFIKIWHEVVSTKTKEEYKDILNEFKKEFNWNNRNVNQPLLNTTPA